MDKFIFSFEMNEERWTREDLRKFLKEVNNDVDHTTLYMVTTDASMDQSLRDKVQNVLGLTDDQIFVESDKDAVINRLTTLKSRLYLSPDQKTVDKVNEDLPLTLEEKQPIEGCQAIALNNIWDNYKIQMKYYTYIDFWTEEIRKFI